MKKLLVWIMVFVLLASCINVLAEGASWTCPECGASNTTKFCTKCGSKQPETINCPGCGMQYPLDTDVIFCGECGTKLREEKDLSRYEGSGFVTPEEAALCYIAGIKNQNFEQILSAFAWETQAEHFDFKAFVTRAKGTDPTYVPGMPAANDLLCTAMVEQLRNEQINVICRALEYYVNDELFTSNTGSLMFKTDEELNEYFNRCENGRIENLSSISNVRFYTPDDLTEGRFSMGKNPQNYLKMNARYGADETKDVVLVADVGKDTVVIAPTIARYGDRWYMVSVGSMTQSICGYETNRLAFYVLQDETKGLLKNITPIKTVATLPSSPEKKFRYEGEGFSSPEDAVNCYVEGLKNGDVQKMLQAFAWETQAERYSLIDYVHRMQSINYNAPVRMQAQNAFMTDMSLGSLRYQQSKRIYAAIKNYVLKDEDKYQDLLNGYRIDLREEEDVDAFIRAFNNDKTNKLKKLHNIRLIDPVTVIQRYNNDSVHKQLDSYQCIYGADEIRDTLVVASMDDETLIFNPLLVRYNDKWYIASVNGIAFSYLSIDVNKQAFMAVDGSFELALMLIQP